MDDRRFDDLARGLGRLPTRRGVLRLVAAALLGPGIGGQQRHAAARTCRFVGEPCGQGTEEGCCAGAACNEDQVGGGICSCPQNLTNCHGLCVDINTNPLACGANCVVCPDDTDCCNGICCEAGQRCCAGVCTDLTSDNNNCGGCTQVCPVGLTCCDSRCRILETNQHCGFCHNVCGVRRTCLDRQCVCQRGYTDCGDGVCRNLKIDRNNCGRCGRRCAPGRRCRNGRCKK